MSLAQYLPDRKVLGGGVAAIVVFAIQLGLAQLGYALPDIYQPLLPAAVGYVISYWLPPAAKDVISRINDTLAHLAGYAPAPGIAAAVVRSEPAAAVAAPTAKDVAKGPGAPEVVPMQAYGAGGFMKP